ncbi:hypothetical protein YN1_0110 [Nanoarchaeota archaeon]
MVKVILIYFNKNEEKLLYNLSILNSFCKKNNYELICITKKSLREYAIKLKNKFNNVKFYLINNKKDIRKLKFNDTTILIYNNTNINLKEVKKGIEDLEDNKIIVFKNKIYKINIINPYIVIGRNIDIYEDFILTYLSNNRKYIESKYNININFYILFTNLLIFIKKSIDLFNKLLNIKYIRDYINEKIGLISYKVITFFLVIILARILTPEFYGSYVTIYNFILILSTLIGSSNIILQKVLSENINNIENQKKYLKLDIYTKILFSLIAIIIISSIIPFLLKSIFYSYNIFIIYITFLTSILLAFDGLGFSIFYSYLKIKEARNLYILEAIFKFIFVVSLSLVLKSSGFIFGLLLAFLSMDIVELYLILRQYPELFGFIKEKINKDIFKNYLSLILKISLPPLLFNLYSSIDIQILRIFTSFQDVGLFYNAMIIVGTISTVFSVSGITLPRILRWEKEKIKERLSKIIGLQLLINLILYGLLILIAPYLILIFFGPSYLLSAELLKYLGIILIIQSFNIFPLILYKKGLEKYYTIYSITSSILSIILDLILIPRFKLEGAVASAILGNLFNVLIGYIIYEKEFDNIYSRSLS